MKFNTMFLATTSKCNGKCFACTRQFVKKIKEFKDLDLSIIKKVVKYANNFILFGNLGDFIFNDNAIEILSFLKIMKPNGIIFFTTNAAKNDDYFWKKMAKIMNKPNKFVEFDVDDIDSEIELYRGVPTELVYHNLELFIKSGGYAKTKTLIFKGNEHKIDKIRKKLKEIGVRESFFIYSRDYIENDEIYGKPSNCEGCQPLPKLRIENYLKHKKVFCELNYKNYVLVNELGEVLNCCGQNYITLEYHLGGTIDMLKNTILYHTDEKTLSIFYDKDTIEKLMYLYEKNKDKITLWNSDVTFESAYNNEYNEMYRKLKDKNIICRYFCALDEKIKNERVFNA